MDSMITDRDHYIKTILLKEFKTDQKTKCLVRYYNNTKATLFISGEQLANKNIKFTQVGINEDNEIYKYKALVELLATIRFIIEQTIGSPVWIDIDPDTLLPTITVCKYNDKKHKWTFGKFVSKFETNISIGYVGVNMYGIASEDITKTVDKQYFEFMNILNESISAQVNETAHTLPENKQLIKIHDDNILIDNRFCFYYTISHKTISSLIRYIINYLKIDVNALLNGTVKIKHDTIDSYLRTVFYQKNPFDSETIINNKWKCDFGVITDCIMSEDNRDKSMLLECISSLNVETLNSFNLVSYLYAKGYHDILLDVVLSRHHSGAYSNIIGLINVYNFLNDIISFDSITITGIEGSHEFKIWFLVLHIYTDEYRKQILSMIESSHYVKLMLLSMDALRYWDDCCIEKILDAMLFYQQKLTFEETYKLEYPRLVGKNEYWSMTLDLLRLIGPDFTNDELRLNKKMLFKMIDKECEC